MPNHEEHCLHSEQRYGVRGDDIHAWMDEPCKIAGQGIMFIVIVFQIYLWSLSYLVKNTEKT